jgi:hypothetical protein
MIGFFMSLEHNGSERVINKLKMAETDYSHYYIHSPTHGAEPFLRSHQLCSYSKISQQFMEPEGSLPRS